MMQLHVGLGTELVACSAMVGFIPEIITRLESNQLPLSAAIELVEEVREKLELNQGARGAKLLSKMENVFKKNIGTKIFMKRRKKLKHFLPFLGYSTLANISKVLNGERISRVSSEQIFEKFTHNEVQCLKFAQVTSCEVERSFSLRNQVLVPQRQSLSVENVESITMCNSYFNK